MKRIMILSGAGLSASSALHTFRGHNGLWENHDVLKVCSYDGWIADRHFVTRFYNERRAELAEKEPNYAHQVLARLEHEFRGRLIHLTQNIDNLLEKAGAKEVIHLHGTLSDLRCEACTETFFIAYAPQEGTEQCPHCGSTRVRHNVVMFGETAPEYIHIQPAIRQSTLLIAIGTSGKVIDIVPIVKSFKHSILIDPNRNETQSMYDPFTYIDQYFEHFIQKNADEAMDEMLILIKRHMEIG